MNNREAQNELCRSTKTPEEVYRIALSYERGYKYAKSYGLVTGGGTSGTAGGAGAFQIKTEPVGTIRGGYRNNRQGRGSFRGRAEMREGGSRRCYNCDQPNFTPEHLQLVQPKMQRVTSAGKRDITRGLVGENETIGEDRQWD